VLKAVASFAVEMIAALFAVRVSAEVTCHSTSVWLLLFQLYFYLAKSYDRIKTNKHTTITMTEQGDECGACMHANSVCNMWQQGSRGRS